MEQLPKQAVATDKRGIYTEYIASYFTHNTLLRNGSRFLHEVKVVITNTSRLIVNFNFNSLVNMFQMKLLAEGWSSGSRYEMGKASFKMQAAQSGDTNAGLLLSGTFYSGTYYLQILQNNVQVPLVANIDQPRCYPFIYDLQIVPNNDMPYIPTISPAAGHLLSPQDPLELEVTFSTRVYSSGVPVTNDDPFKRSLYLFDTVNPSAKIYASSAYPETVGNTWHLVFPAQFTSRKSYKLGLDSGILTNSFGDAVILISTNIYSMIDTSCNGLGTFDRGYCFCNMGYAGEECTTCDVGYKNTATGGQLVCQKQIDNLCVLSSCGCAPGKTPCEPLGQCDSSSGQIVCQCFGHYAGPDCSSCAPGYADWKAGCTPVPQGCPTCQHGTCNEGSKICTCDAHYKGRTCDECDDGWSGTDCSTEVNTPKPTPTGAVKSAALTAVTVISITITVGMILGTLALLIYRKFFKPTKYSQLELSTLEDDL
jgi:hypothetical protein